MTHRVYGKVYLKEGFHPTCYVFILDSGWIFVEENGKYYPPTRVDKVDPMDPPEGRGMT